MGSASKVTQVSMVCTRLHCKVLVLRSSEIWAFDDGIIDLLFARRLSCLTVTNLPGCLLIHHPILRLWTRHHVRMMSCMKIAVLEVATLVVHFLINKHVLEVIVVIVVVRVRVFTHYRQAGRWLIIATCEARCDNLLSTHILLLFLFSLL